MKLFWKILIPLTIMAIVIISVVVAQNVITQTDRLKQNDRNVLESHYSILINFIRQQEEKLVALAANIAHNPDVQEAFAKGDRELLFELIKPGYQKLKQDNLISSTAYFKPPAINFLLPHRLEDFNKDESEFKQSIVIANQEKRPVTGIEAGVASLSIRGDAPVSYSGKHIGVVEFLRFIDKSLLQEMSELIHSEFSIYLPEEKKTFMTKVEWGKYAPDGFLCYSTTTERTLPIAPELYQQVMQTGKKVITEISDSGHTFEVLIAPLLDFKGDVSAIIEMRTLKDKALAEIAQSRNAGLLHGIIILIISALLIWQIVQRVITKPIAHLNKAADEISMGNLNVSIKVTSKDEIKDLAESLERMRTSLKGAIKRLQAGK